MLTERKPHLVLFKVSEHNHKTLTTLKEDSAYEVNTAINNILNTEELFSLVNDLTYNSYTLSYDIAFKELSRIEQTTNFEIDIVNW